MGSSAQQLCIVRMNVAKAVGRCRQMQSIYSTQKDRCRQPGIDELGAFEHALR